jgi:hypothetical protein
MMMMMTMKICIVSSVAELQLNLELAQLCFSV